MSTEINGNMGSLMAAATKDVFNAQLVTKTLTALNGSGSSPMPVDKASAEAQLVTRTLDTLNGSSTRGVGLGSQSDYDFQKDVLGGYALGKGLIINDKT